MPSNFEGTVWERPFLSQQDYKARSTVQVKLEELLEYCAKVNLFQQFNLICETNIYYRLITCKVRYFKLLFVIILMIMAYS